MTKRQQVLDKLQGIIEEIVPAVKHDGPLIKMVEVAKLESIRDLLIDSWSPMVRYDPDSEDSMISSAFDATRKSCRAAYLELCEVIEGIR